MQTIAKLGCIAILGSCILLSCTSNHVDIGNEEAVLGHLQGTWTGFEKTGELYAHYKLFIEDHNFSGWIQTAETAEEPEWSVLPSENGKFTMGALIEAAGNQPAYRDISFIVPGRCCGDKSIAIRTLNRLITYDENRGLSISHSQPLAKK